ncbi:hypothetical protein ACFLQ2_03910 [archaeon]
MRGRFLLFVLLILGIAAAACTPFTGTGATGTEPGCFTKDFSGAGTLQVWSEEGASIDVSCLGESGSSVTGVFGGGSCTFSVDSDKFYGINTFFAPASLALNGATCSPGDEQCINNVRWVCFGSSQGTMLLQDGSCKGTEMQCAPSGGLRCFHDDTYKCVGVPLSWDFFGSGCAGRSSGDEISTTQWTNWQHSISKADQYIQENEETEEEFSEQVEPWTKYVWDTPGLFSGEAEQGGMCSATYYNYEELQCKADFAERVDVQVSGGFGFSFNSGIASGWSGCNTDSLNVLKEYVETYEGDSDTFDNAMGDEEELLFQSLSGAMNPKGDCDKLEEGINDKRTTQRMEGYREAGSSHTSYSVNVFEDGKMAQVSYLESLGPTSADYTALENCRECQRKFDQVSQEFFYLANPEERELEWVDNIGLGLVGVELVSGAACAGTWWALGGACWVTGAAGVLEFAADMYSGGKRVESAVGDGDWSRLGFNLVFLGVSAAPVLTGGGARKITKGIFGILDDVPLLARKLDVTEDAITALYRGFDASDTRKFTTLVKGSGPEAGEAVIEAVIKSGVKLDDAIYAFKHGPEGLDLLTRAQKTGAIDDVMRLLTNADTTTVKKVLSMSEDGVASVPDLARVFNKYDDVGLEALKQTDVILKLGDDGAAVFKGSKQSGGEVLSAVSEGLSMDKLKAAKGADLVDVEKVLDRAAGGGKIFDYTARVGGEIKPVSVKRIVTETLDDRKATSKISNALSDMGSASKNLPGGKTYSEKSILHVLVRNSGDKQVVEGAFKTLVQQSPDLAKKFELVADVVPSSLLH